MTIQSSLLMQNSIITVFMVIIITQRLKKVNIKTKNKMVDTKYVFQYNKKVSKR